MDLRSPWWAVCSVSSCSGVGVKTAHLEVGVRRSNSLAWSPWPLMEAWVGGQQALPVLHPPGVCGPPRPGPRAAETNPKALTPQGCAQQHGPQGLLIILVLNAGNKLRALSLEWELVTVTVTVTRCHPPAGEGWHGEQGMSRLSLPPFCFCFSVLHLSPPLVPAQCQSLSHLGGKTWPSSQGTDGQPGRQLGWNDTCPWRLAFQDGPVECLSVFVDWLSEGWGCASLSRASQGGTL